MPGIESRRLLVVEDAIDIQTLLRKLFEIEGYHVTCASNGQEALDKLKASESLPHLILLDLMMPVMDGYGFIEHQKQNPLFAKIPLVVMTADADVKAKKKEGIALGFLKKPIDIDLLLSTVKRFCVTPAETTLP